MDLPLHIQGLNILSAKPSGSRRRITKASLYSLYHSNLEPLPDFQDLLFHLTSFYATKSSQTSRWKEILHNSLFSLLNELVYTQDRESQLSLLAKVREWYYSKIQPARRIPHQPTKSEAFERKPRLSTAETTAVTIPNTPYSRKKPITPQPKTRELLNTTYRAFVNNTKPDPELENRVSDILEAMQKRQHTKMAMSWYKDSKE
jgi:hypothetical protein